MANTSKHKKLSLPFVVTVAAAATVGAATLLACHDEEPNDGPCTDANACAPTNDDACPNQAPAAEARCTTEGLRCDFDRCDAHYTKSATCAAGSWSLQYASCNPPFPQPDAGACPAEVPEGDTPCVSRQDACDYGDCYGTPTHHVTCGVDNKWSVSEMSCNPPPPPPVDAGSCVGNASADASEQPCSNPGAQCDFGEVCNGKPVNHAFCTTDGYWSITRGTCTPPPADDGGVCPTARPLRGAACSDSGQACTYGDCYGEPTYIATCGADRTWDAVEISCNPPPPSFDGGSPTP